MRKGLHEAGIRRERAKAVPAEKGENAPRRYGYKQARRRQLPEQDPGVPPRYPRRLLADACCYVVRAGARMFARRLTTTWFCKHPHRSGEQYTTRI